MSGLSDCMGDAMAARIIGGVTLKVVLNALNATPEQRRDISKALLESADRFTISGADAEKIRARAKGVLQQTALDISPETQSSPSQ